MLLMKNINNKYEPEKAMKFRKSTNYEFRKLALMR